MKPRGLKRELLTAFSAKSSVLRGFALIAWVRKKFFFYLYRIAMLTLPLIFKEVSRAAIGTPKVDFLLFLVDLPHHKGDD
jgi:hypothetical protein